MTAFRSLKVLVYPYKALSSTPSQPNLGINDAPSDYTQTFLHLTILLLSPNLKVPGLSSLSPRPCLFVYLPSVLGLSSLSPGLLSLSFRPILPQSQAYLLAVSGLSSRFIFHQFQPIFPQFQPIFPQFQPIFPQSLPSVPGLSSPSPSLSPIPGLPSLSHRPILLRPGVILPCPSPIFPESQAILSSVPGLSPPSPVPLSYRSWAPIC